MSTGTAATAPSTQRSGMFAPISSDLLVLALRFVVGWMFFSAAWRRLVLEPGKMSPGNAAWVGGKINHFYPQAIGFKPMFEWLLTNPDALNVFMWVFTIIELFVGLGITFGLFSRLSAIGITLLSFSMLLAAGWLGATCLDEWQIGCFGIGAGLMLAMTGVGWRSFDRLVGERWSWWTSKPMAWLATGRLMGARPGRIVSVALAAFTVIAMLGTNQAFVGGLWGPLSNPSAKPHVQVSEVADQDGTLTMQVFRDKGPDTYGAFVTELEAQDASGAVVADLKGEDLAALFKEGTIKNTSVNKVKAGPDGLILPLGAEATVTVTLPEHSSEISVVRLRDASGV